MSIADPVLAAKLARLSYRATAALAGETPGFAFGLIRRQDARAEEEPCDACTKQWRDDEEPHRSERAFEESRTKAACRIDGNAGDVDAENVDRRQREPDGKARQVRGRALLRDAKDGDEEDERCHGLEHKGGDDVEFTQIPRAPAICAKRAAPSRAFSGQDQVKHGRSGYRTEALRDCVADEIAGRHASGHPRAKADGGIHVAARYWPYAIGHRDNGKPERQRNAKKADLLACNSCRAAADKHQRESSDKLCN